MKSFLFEELHPYELKDIIKKSGIIFLPLGSLEWHERHLPFGLDAFVAYEICKSVCKKIGGCVIPPLYFGTDKEHVINGRLMHGMDAKAGKVLSGSIYFLKSNLFYEILKSISKNIHEQGFKKLIIVSGHSGTAQNLAIEKLAKEKIGDLKIFVFPGRKFPGGLDHAGKIETSLMSKINKDLVNINKLKKPYIGTMGDDPKKFTKEDGLRQLNEIVKDIIEKVK